MPSRCSCSATRRCQKQSGSSVSFSDLNIPTTASTPTASQKDVAMRLFCAVSSFTHAIYRHAKARGEVAEIARSPNVREIFAQLVGARRAGRNPARKQPSIKPQNVQNAQESA